MLTRAFNVAKRIRSETEIGQSAVSVSYAAVELAREIFGSLKQEARSDFGAGKMSEGRRGIFSALAPPRFSSPIARRSGRRNWRESFAAKWCRYDSFPQRLPRWISSSRPRPPRIM